MNKRKIDRQIESALSQVTLPDGVFIRAWREADFAAIQQLSSAEGWTTPQDRPDGALIAWRQSWPALVATDGESVIGFARALTDGKVTTYITEILVEPKRRGEGIGRALIDVCHYLYPRTRIDLLSTESADSFYKALGFRPFQGFRKSY